MHNSNLFIRFKCCLTLYLYFISMHSFMHKLILCNIFGAFFGHYLGARKLSWIPIICYHLCPTRLLKCIRYSLKKGLRTYYNIYNVTWKNSRLIESLLWDFVIGLILANSKYFKFSECSKNSKLLEDCQCTEIPSFWDGLFGNSMIRSSGHWAIEGSRLNFIRVSYHKKPCSRTKKIV